MVVFSHRGIGFGSKENSLNNFKNAITEGFSIEADLRMSGVKIILSHDETGAGIFEFDGLMGLASEYPDILFALHLKENSEVLINRASQAINGKKNCFLFCTDFPQESFIRKFYAKIGKGNLALYVTGREICLNLVNKVDYLWLDESKHEIYRDLSYFKKLEKKIICCSPELFQSGINNEKMAFFERLTKDQDLFGICTDFPRKLR